MTPLTSVEQPRAPVLAANGDEVLYEVVNGQRVEAPYMGAYETSLASILIRLLGTFAATQDRGRVVGETLFLIDQATQLQRRPDLAIEFRAWSTNTADDILGKVREYFRAGVLRVWVIFSEMQQVYIYESPTQNRVLVRHDELNDETLLPGFRLPLVDLFEEEASEQTEPPGV